MPELPRLLSKFLLYIIRNKRINCIVNLIFQSMSQNPEYACSCYFTAFIENVEKSILILILFERPQITIPAIILICPLRGITMVFLLQNLQSNFPLVIFSSQLGLSCETDNLIPKKFHKLCE